MWVDPATDLQDLLEDGRIAEAEAMLAEFLEAEPAASSVHALRALLLKELGREDEALEAAEHATRIDPRDGFAHWVVGALKEARHRYREALASAVTARDLRPHDPDAWVLIGQIHAAQGRWRESLDALEGALELDPEHEAASNLRVLCRRYLASDEPWEAQVEALVERYPASGWARAGRGWAALEQGAATEARQHFEQAVALDPTSEWARSGLAEALKAENPLYRRILRMLLWFDRQSPRVRWGIILGGIIAYRYLRGASEATPALRIVAYPVMAAWVLFILLSWLAAPLSDFVLSLDRTGRRVLDRDRRLAGRAVASVLGVAVSAGALGLVTGLERVAMAGMVAAFLVIPVAAIHRCEPGWPRTTMMTYTFIASVTVPVTAVAGDPASAIAFVTGMLMAVAGSWFGVFLASRRVAR